MAARRSRSLRESRSFVSEGKLFQSVDAGSCPEELIPLRQVCFRLDALQQFGRQGSESPLQKQLQSLESLLKLQFQHELRFLQSGKRGALPPPLVLADD